MSDTEEEILLMLVPDQKQVFPFVASGMNVTFGTPKTVLEEFGSAIFLDQSGFLFSIESAEFVNNTFLTRLKTRFGEPKATLITVQTKQVNISFDAFISTLLDCIKSFYDEEDDWWLLNTPYTEVEKTILTAKTFKDLHATMNFPEPYVCLDAL